MKNPISCTIVLLSAILFSAGCATQTVWSRYELCFGRTADGGKVPISEQEWQRFSDAEILARFPDGFTVCHADGFWRSGATTHSEPSEILMVVAPDTEDTQKKLDAIARAYALQFRQESVLQIKAPATVEFHTPK